MVSLERKIRKIFGSLLLAGSLSGCYVTGSDVLGTALQTGSAFISNPYGAVAADKVGGLASLNAQRGHEVRRAEAGATRINIDSNQHFQTPSKSYNPVYDLNLEVDVSPDKKTIVFSKTFSESDNAEIFSTDINGENLKRLTFTPDKKEYSPCWSPDGKRIAYFETDIPYNLIKMKEWDPWMVIEGEAVKESEACPMNISRYKYNFYNLPVKSCSTVIGRIHIFDFYEGKDKIIEHIAPWSSALRSAGRGNRVSTVSNCGGIYFSDSKDPILFWRKIESLLELKNVSSFMQSNFKLSWVGESNLELIIKQPYTKIDIELFSSDAINQRYQREGNGAAAIVGIEDICKDYERLVERKEFANNDIKIGLGYKPTKEQIEKFGRQLKEYKKKWGEDDKLTTRFDFFTGEYLSILIEASKEKEFKFDLQNVWLSYIGSCLKEKKVEIDGDVGEALGACAVNSEITVTGNAGDLIGVEAKGSKIIVSGDAGKYVGETARETEIWIKGKLESLGHVGEGTRIYEGADKKQVWPIN